MHFATDEVPNDRIDVADMGIIEGRPRVAIARFEVRPRSALLSFEAPIVLQIESTTDRLRGAPKTIGPYTSLRECRESFAKNGLSTCVVQFPSAGAAGTMRRASTIWGRKRDKKKLDRSAIDEVGGLASGREWLGTTGDLALREFS